MTDIDKKREEIREEFTRLIADSYKELQSLNNIDPVTHNIDKGIRTVLFKQSSKFLEYLHSQGVVIKVDEPIYSQGVLVTTSAIESLVKES